MSASIAVQILLPDTYEPTTLAQGVFGTQDELVRKCLKRLHEFPAKQKYVHSRVWVLPYPIPQGKEDVIENAVVWQPRDSFLDLLTSLTETFFDVPK